MAKRKEPKEPLIESKSKKAKVQQAKEVVLGKQMFPNQLPILPFDSRPSFPKMIMPLILEDEDTIDLIREIYDSHNQFLGLVLRVEEEEDEEADNIEIHEVGVLAQILKFETETDRSQHQVVLGIIERFRIKKIVSHSPMIVASVEYLEPEAEPDDKELKAYSISIINDIKELVKLNPIHKEELTLLMSQSDMQDPGVLADFAAALTTHGAEELQKVLETIDIRKRVELVLYMLKEELDVSKLQFKINKQIEAKITKQQREYFLREQLKAIKKELGLSKESKEQELEKIEKRLEKRNLSAEASQKLEEELDVFKVLESSSPEYHTVRNYLDWLSDLPWGIYSEENKNIDKAEKVLQRDHYGLDDVKERILEFLSVGIKRGKINGSIICLLGPPGVGKTSIGRSIAESLGREFYRFSLGGMRDEAEIKGHRRTYIGAMPGKFIQAIRSCGASNPLIMLDEIDKVGSSYQGDPASALLEVLDPEQNKDFLDHYLDVRYDLSNVLFVCTANQLDTIPSALFDRMEIIHLSGYIQKEKVQIAKKFIIPKQLKEHGLKAKELTFSDLAIKEVIDGYAREPGVRSLEKHIKKIIRRKVREQLKHKKRKLNIEKADVEKILGGPYFRDEDLSPRVPGVVNGLAWTSMGGSVMTIEATGLKGKKGFKQTGQLGNVMVESAQIAYTFIQAYLEENTKAHDYFLNRSIHLHVPAGATPKDGPSAGMAMAIALYSLALGMTVRRKLAMTGELSLTGRIMPIGGLKEKAMAAKRSGITTIVIPEDNRRDFNECPDSVKRGMKPIFVNSFHEIEKVCFNRQEHSGNS